MNNWKRKSLEILYSSSLEALRQREKDVIIFLGFIIPSFSGFVILVKKYLELDGKHKNLPESEIWFFLGYLLVSTFSLIGSCYTMALSYNFRYLIQQIRRIEKEDALGIDKYIIFSNVSKNDKSKLKFLPEILKVFVYAYLVCIFIFTGVAYFIIPNCICWLVVNILIWLIVDGGVYSLLLRKLKKYQIP